ncbi:MAG: hypothetical protein GY841_19420 [FCB group bacterium]|nr:hypothetical protein [FCB group bacterium]
MKKLLIILCLLPAIGYGQYWGERVTEKSFEQSSLYFESYFLNPFGLHRFDDAAVGLIDNPFLGLQINPANLPNLEGKNYLMYLDFRGDRTEEAVIDNYYAMPMYDLYYYPPMVYYNTARDEPQPIFSFGLLTYPFGPAGTSPFVGGTYQMIYQQEKYYSVPSWNYNYRFGYDSFGDNTLIGSPIIPVEDRYFGKDELLTQAHMFSLFAGYAFSDRLDLGLSLNRTVHSRDGGYINIRNDQYSSTDDDDWRYYNQEERNQDYDHLDLSGGIRYQLREDLSGGIKLGYLKGDADQDFMTLDSSSYSWNMDGVSDRWGYSIGKSHTNKTWNRDGHIWYGRVNIERQVEKDRTISAYYRYGRTDIDLTNTLIIRDTSYYASQYAYDTLTYNYESLSWTRDTRQGFGQRKEYAHEAMISADWKLNREHTVLAGLYLARSKTTQTSEEPVVAERWSEYESRTNGEIRYDYLYNIYEDKVLVWESNSTYWTVQIPIMLKIQAAKFLMLTFGVNRILEGSKTTDVTTAYFTLRRSDSNGDVESESFFGERYTQPEEKITEDETVFMTSFDLTVSEQFNIRLMVNPEIEDDFRVAEWWLSFQYTP